MPARMWPHSIHLFPQVHRFPNDLKLFLLMPGRSGDRGYTQDRVQSYLWGITQQGTTFVPGKESQESRTNRVNTTMKAVDHHFSSPSAAQQGAIHYGATSDLNGVGQQFHGYTRQ